MAYIVQKSAAKMPSSCKGKYVRIAVLEVADGVTHVSMISDRAKGVKRVVRTWEGCHDGKTAKSASHLALAEAHELAFTLNQSAS